MNFDAIPAALKARRQWVLLRKKRKRKADGSRYWTKVPYQANGQKARTHNSRDKQYDGPASDTWCSFEEAVAAYQDGGFDGIGYVFAEDDPFTGIDLDKLTDWAWAWVKRLNSYTERSQSGEGLHIIVEAKLPPAGRKKGKFEIYDSKRFFVMTGDHVDGTPLTIEARQEQVDALHAEVFKPKPEPARVAAGADSGPVTLSDQEVIATALQAKNGKKFKKLWEGNISGYPSDSEAEAAFLRMLRFYCRRDEAQMDRIFRQSGLYRDKWEREDYRERTFAVSRDQQEFYSGRAPDPAPASLTIHGGDGQVVPPSAAPDHDYGAENGQLFIEKEKKDKKGESYFVREIIADFDAHITEEITLDDGQRIYRIDGIQGRRPFSLEIEATKFEEERSLKAAIGAAAGAKGPVRAGMTKHLPAAIKLLSRDVRTRRRRQRTGYDGGRFIIPGREAPGEEIELPPQLPYRVEPTGNLQKAQEALRAALHVVSPQKTTIVLAFILTAMLARHIRLLKKYVLFIKGRTGSWKTSLMQVFLCLFGPDFIHEEKLLKFGEGATRNALLQIAGYAHDMPLLQDNFKPNTGGGDQELISLIHAIVEGSEKARLNQNSELKEQRELRCWLACTGEDLPQADAAALARLLVLEFSQPESTRNPELDRAQLLSEHLPALGNAWIEWLESEEGRQAGAEANKLFPEIRAGFAAYLKDVQPDAVNALRVASNLASNRIAYEVAMQCPAFADILAPLWEDFQAGLRQCADTMADYTAESVEAHRFLAGLKSLMASGRATFPDRLGLNTDLEETRRIGWKDSQGYYVIMDAAIGAVDELYRRSGGLNGISTETLLSQIEDLGLIASRQKTKRTKPVKVYGGTLCRVLHLKREALDEAGEES